MLANLFGIMKFIGKRCIFEGIFTRVYTPKRNHNLVYALLGWGRETLKNHILAFLAQAYFSLRERSPGILSEGLFHYNIFMRVHFYSHNIIIIQSSKVPLCACESWYVKNTNPQLNDLCGLTSEDVIYGRMIRICEKKKLTKN